MELLTSSVGFEGLLSTIICLSWPLVLVIHENRSLTGSEGRLFARLAADESEVGLFTLRETGL